MFANQDNGGNIEIRVDAPDLPPCRLTTHQAFAMDDVAFRRALVRRNISPEYRGDAGTLNPATLSNEDLLAIFNPILVRTYIDKMTMSFPRTATQIRNYFRVAPSLFAQHGAPKESGPSIPPVIDLVPTSRIFAATCEPRDF